MALQELPRSESRKLYSWWWDSHISPKNSKWFRDNLADMDLKIKSMIKLIEEDADTFSRRAELYFQKRPELIELVEEFYRAYRALAERYDCATVELRRAHGPITEPIIAAESNNFVHLSAGEASVFVEILEKIRAEKENLARSFHENLQNLFVLEREIADTGGFDKTSNRTRVEVKVLKETMKKLLSERDETLEKCKNCRGDEKETCFLKYNQCVEMVSILEELVKEEFVETVQEQETITSDLTTKVQHLVDLKSLSQATIENLRKEVKNLNEEKARLENEKEQGGKAEKETLLWQIRMMLENVQRLSEKNALAENALVRANVENENLRFKTAALEESCQILKDEKIAHLNEKNSLGLRMGNLESKFSKLEEKCGEKGAGNEIGKAVDAEVEIQMLQKFVEDLEQKNIALLFECQKHVESAKLTKKIMAELEDDSVEQQAEIECLLDEIEKLRMGIRKIFKALHLGSNEDIESLTCSLQNTENEKQMLGVQNLVLLSFFDQRSEEMKIDFDNLQLVNEKLTDKLIKQGMEIGYLCRSNEEMSARMKDKRLNEEKFLAEIQAYAVRETLLSSRVDELQDKVAFLENKIELSQRQNLTDEDIFPPTPGFTDRFQVSLQNSGKIDHANDGEAWGDMKVYESKDIPLDETSEFSSIDSQQLRHFKKRNVVVLSKTLSKRNRSRNGRSYRWNGIPEPPVDRFHAIRTASEEVRAEFREKTILQRLESDAKRLMSSELVVQELMKKMEAKNKVKQSKNGEAEMIRERLMGAEEAILQLFSSTNQLAREIQTIEPKDKDGAGESGREGIAERAIKGSDMVGCVQFEVENIQSKVVNLLGGKKGKAKSTFLGKGNLFKKFNIADESKKNWDSACLCGYGKRPTPGDFSGRFVL